MEADPLHLLRRPRHRHRPPGPAGTPRYFVSLRANGGFRLQGSHLVYHPTSKAFKIFLIYHEAAKPVDAEGFGWAVVWIGVPKSDPRSSTVGDTSNWLVETPGTWNVAENGGGLVMDVDTKVNNFDPHITPTYVTSVVYTGTMAWRVAGGAALYDVRSSGFRIYLGKSLGVQAMSKSAWSFMDKKNFLVNYIGYEDERPRACVMSQWSLWTLCTKSCGGALKMRTRTVIKRPLFNGAPCGKKSEEKKCATNPCPINCAVSDWNAWSQCSRDCGGGVKNRARSVLKYAEDGGLKCAAKLKETAKCNDVYCIGEGGSHFCGATTGDGTADGDNYQSNWQLYGTDGLKVTINTTFCKFPIKPYYVVSLLGDDKHWELAGTDSVAHMNETSFDVIIIHPDLRGEALVKAAKAFNWRVSWIGDTGSNAGQTVPGDTGWKEIEFTKWDMVVASHRTIYTDVDTTMCGFVDKTYYSKAPRYITAIHGDKEHWRTRGAHIVHKPTRKGFRIYVTYDKDVSCIKAELWKWTVAWIGTTGKHSGTSSLGWKNSRHKQDGGGQYIDVDTTSSNFILKVPTYVVSITTTDLDWKQTAQWVVGTIFNPTASGFRVYLNNAHNDTVLDGDKWRVNYIGYEGNVDCKLSDWSGWSACACGLGKNKQTRTRRVLQMPSTWGKQCSTELSQSKWCYRTCHPPTPQPTPAAVSNPYATSYNDPYAPKPKTPPPTPPVDPLNSPQTQEIFLSITIVGYSKDTFTADRQLALRVGLAETIGVDSAHVRTKQVKNSDYDRRLRAQADPAPLTDPAALAPPPPPAGAVAVDAATVPPPAPQLMNDGDMVAPPATAPLKPPTAPAPSPAPVVVAAPTNAPTESALERKQEAPFAAGKS
jgi:hypothetical protein